MTVASSEQLKDNRLSFEAEAVIFFYFHCENKILWLLQAMQSELHHAMLNTPSYHLPLYPRKVKDTLPRRSQGSNRHRYSDLKGLTPTLLYHAHVYLSIKKLPEISES